MSKNKTEVNPELLPATSEIGKGLEKINEKLKTLKRIQESVYKTTGKLAGFTTNLKDETKTTELIKMFSAVQGRAEAYDKAAASLGYETFPVFKLEGSTVDEWRDDIKLRIDIIENKERLDELNSIKKDLEGLMDKEDKLAMIKARLEKI
jgi:hypothetical protein